MTKARTDERQGEVRIRRYTDCLECDVVVVVRGSEMVVTLPDYRSAVDWARMECKAYKIPGKFSEAANA